MSVNTKDYALSVPAQSILSFQSAGVHVSLNVTTGKFNLAIFRCVKGAHGGRDEWHDRFRWRLAWFDKAVPKIAGDDWVTHDGVEDNVALAMNAAAAQIAKLNKAAKTVVDKRQ